MSTETNLPTSTLFRPAMVLGGLAGCLGVALAAVAAHADPSGLMRAASEMLLFHAPAILVLGVMAQVRRIPLLPVATALLVAGLVLFCGDLASRALQDARLFPMAAPTGGMLLIAGWAAIVLSAATVKAR
jgi:uncharacterized membrane protein YgdD (TMEM256/DUF423 family)